MTCRELIEFLMDYTSGMLPAEQRAEFERHLSLCPPCVAYLKTYEQTVRLSRDAMHVCDDGPAHPAPEELVRAVMAAKRKAAQTSAERPPPRGRREA